MKFEEQFPSLKDTRMDYGHSGVRFDAIRLEDLEKHCLDKQRVKERWKYLKGHIPTKFRDMNDGEAFLREFDNCIAAIEKELGVVK